MKGNYSNRKIYKIKPTCEHEDAEVQRHKYFASEWIHIVQNTRHLKLGIIPTLFLNCLINMEYKTAKSSWLRIIRVNEKNI